MMPTFAFIVTRNHNPLRLFQFFGKWCFYLVCGVAVPNNEFAVLGGADQKPDEKKDKIKQQNNLKLPIPSNQRKNFL